MSLRRLKWAFFATLLAALLLLEYARLQLAPYLGSLPGRLVMAGAVIVSIVFVAGAAFSVIARMQERLEAQNRELIALRRAGLDIHGELALSLVLQKVVDQARKLLDATYGAITVLDEVGEIREFVVSGLSEAERTRIGEPPRGRGLLGVTLHETRPLRVAEIAADPRAAGFPPGHPVMRSMVAVPIVCKGPFRGNLYVADKEGGRAFPPEDEATLFRFAQEAAIAIDNAHVHQQLETLAVSKERLRISREMHDGMAQILAYVNTKAQAVREFLHRGREAEAEAQLEQLAAATREVYTDVREGILALRTQPGPDRSLGQALEEFVEQWRIQTGTQAGLRIEGDLELPPPVELQVLRIIQEALSNVRKHAHAKRAEVVIGQMDGKLVATVADDGKGFDPELPQPGRFPRFGLSVMRERAQSVGGTLKMDSKPGQGTRIEVEIPLTT